MTVDISTDDGVATITINRPGKLNALASETVAELANALSAANRDGGVRAVILTGAGSRAFSVGKDLDDDDPMEDERRAEATVNRLQDITRRIVESPKIYIAAVNGWAVGAGFEIALNCDLSVWAKTARAFMPELKWGLYPSGASTVSIARRAGTFAAFELLLLEERMTAERLQALGLAWRVVPDAELLAETGKVAKQIAGLPEKRVSDFKAAANKALYGDLESVIAAENRALLAALRDPETMERISAFAGRSDK